MCSVLEASPSGYYDWLARVPSERAEKNARLVKAIKSIHKASHENYGIRKVWQQLLREGWQCGKNRVARLRKEHSIYAKRRKRFVITTRSKHRHWIAPNRLNRDFTSDKPNDVWVSDVTFVPTRSGWLYVAVTLDLYSRKVVGWSMSNRNDGTLVRDCLEMAIAHRQPGRGLIHHSDRGSTYAMQSFRDILREYGIESSMSRKGDCWDNAVAESFFSSLKNELTYWKQFKDRAAARSAIFNYIEVFYNRQRLHQTLGYKTPVEFEINVA